MRTEPLVIEEGITVMRHECERICSSVPIHFGKGVSLADDACIYCTEDGEDIYIGDDNMIHGRLILHPGVKIGDHCSFGTGTIIVAGKYHIGHRCVLSHGCTVTEDIPDDSLVVGRRGLILRK